MTTDKTLTLEEAVEEIGVVQARLRDIYESNKDAESTWADQADRLVWVLGKLALVKQPDSEGWIPCSERLPEEAGFYSVWGDMKDSALGQPQWGEYRLRFRTEPEHRYGFARSGDWRQQPTHWRYAAKGPTCPKSGARDASQTRPDDPAP